MNSLSLTEKIINYSKLADVECALILENNLLEALEIEDPTYLEVEIISKFAGMDFTLREDLCKLLNVSVKRNRQKIGNLIVGEWIQKYIKKYAFIPREIYTFLEYSSNDPEIRMLNEKDQIRLIKILRIYDFLLVEPFFDTEDVQIKNMLHFPLYLSQSLSTIKAQLAFLKMESPNISGRIIIRKVLSEALQLFPKIGEQAVTSGVIKLKNYDHPVRPSIKNWLYDYASHLGQGPHDPMQRMNYLFRSENTERLSSQEREKLGIILKSFDENTPLTIDTDNQEVVFENLEVRSGRPEMGEKKSIPESSFVRPYSPAGAAPRPISQSAAVPDRVQPFPSPLSQGIHQDQTLSNYSKPSFNAPLPKIDHSFKPEVAKFKQPSQNLEKSSAFPSRETSSRDSSKPSFTPAPETLQYFNPYPTPEKHEVKFDQISVPSRETQRDMRESGQTMTGSPLAPQQNISSPGQSPINVKGFTEKQSVQPKKGTPSASSKKPVYIPPNRPKNVLYPHNYFAEKDEKPEVRIEGNVVDLSGQQ